VPTVVQGGSASNRLPEGVTLTFDNRHVAEDQPEQIMAALRECFRGGRVSLQRGGVPLASDPNDPQIKRLAACAARVTGQPTHMYREHFASDARFYSALHIPAVCFGPVGAGLHSDEEWVDIASLEHVYNTLRAFVEAENRS
jgi:succinyl-diaminopimelate desuccinylase